MSPFFRAAIAERRPVFAHPKALGLITGLIVAVGVTLPVVASMHPLGSATSPASNARSGEAYVPGALAGYAGPEDWALAEGGAIGGYAYRPGPLAGYDGPEVWALAEGGPFGSVIMPSSEVVQDWARAEGGYYGKFVVPSPAVARDWALAEGGPFGLYAYQPGPLAGYDGPEAWALAEGGVSGSEITPSPEVAQDRARAEGGYLW